MKALVVYESIWGNTEKIARAIATGLAAGIEVDVVDSESAPLAVVDYDLLVVGGPTHAFSMTRASTRASAVEQKGAPRAPERGIREWLGELARTESGVSAATFDTRVDVPRLPGSAAKAAKHELRSLGFTILAKQESFRVHGYEGPIIEGELERATEWGGQLAAAMSSATAGVGDS